MEDTEKQSEILLGEEIKLNVGVNMVEPLKESLIKPEPDILCAQTEPLPATAPTQVKLEPVAVPPQPKRAKHNYSLIISVILLLAAVSYIGLIAYQSPQHDQVMIQQGQKLGAAQTIVYLFQQGLSCLPTPVTVQNQTINMIPVECVYQRVAQCKVLPITSINQTLNLFAIECLRNTTS